MWRLLRSWLGARACDGGHAAVLAPPAPEHTRDDGAPYPRLLAPERQQPEHDPFHGWWNADDNPADSPTPPAATTPNHHAATIDQALYDELTAVLRDPGVELPRLPAVAQRALAMLRSPDLDYGKLADLVGQDPALTAQLLRAANSPLYRGVNAFTRLDQVFARLGQRGLHSLLATLSLRGLAIRTGGPCRSIGEQLWQRAVAAAETAAAIAPLVQRDPEHLFVLGLLHDIGYFAILRIVHDYQRAHATRLPRALFDRIGDEWHTHIGLRLADEWDLPSPLPDIIARHHGEPALDDPLATERLVMQLANAACDQLGYGGRRVTRDLLDLPCAVRLGLRPNLRTCEVLEAIPPRIEQRLSDL